MDKRFELLPELMKAAISCLQQLHNTPDALAMPAVLGVANLAASLSVYTSCVCYQLVCVSQQTTMKFQWALNAMNNSSGID